jgi:hypothetical protein
LNGLLIGEFTIREHRVTARFLLTSVKSSAQEDSIPEKHLELRTPDASGVLPFLDEERQAFMIKRYA